MVSCVPYFLSFIMEIGCRNISLLVILNTNIYLVYTRAVVGKFFWALRATLLKNQELNITFVMKRKLIKL